MYVDIFGWIKEMSIWVVLRKMGQNCDMDIQKQTLE